MGHGGLGLESCNDFVERQIVVAQDDVEFIGNYHVIAWISDHPLDLLPSSACHSNIASAILRVPRDNLAHRFAFDLIGESIEHRLLDRRHTPLHALDDPDIPAMPTSPSPHPPHP